MSRYWEINTVVDDNTNVLGNGDLDYEEYGKIAVLLNHYVRKEEGKGLSSNDFTDEDVSKLNGIEDEAQVNVLETISVNNGTPIEADENKNINLTIPTKTSDLENDSDFAVTSEDTTFTEDVTVEGDLTVNGDISGNLSIIGNESVSNDLSVGNDLFVDGDTTLHDTDVNGDLTVSDNLSVGDDTTLSGDLSVGGTSTLHGTDVNGNLTVTQDISVGDDLTVTDDTSVGGDLTVNGKTTLKNTQIDGDTVISGTTTVHGDLWVDGVTHTTTEEQINTTSDTIVLRQNNSTSLGATYSGIIINKYNGTNELALVTDSDGTLRLGTGNGTDTVYADIYWDDLTEKWYSDSSLTTEVTPQGSLTSWQSVETIGDVKHYTNAVFTVINFNGIVPIMCRDEAINLDDGALLQWDNTNLMAKTIPLPNADGQILVNHESQSAFDKHIITINDILYEEYPTTPFTGTIPAGTTSTSDTINFSTNGDYYYSETENAIYIDDSGTYVKLTSIYYDSTDDEWLDGEASESSLPLDAVQISSPSAIHYTRAFVPKHYQWEIKSGNFVFNTMSDYTSVASTVPDGSSVFILDEDNYIIGDVQ